MVRAGRADLDRACHDQLGKAAHVLERRDSGRFAEAAIHQVLDIHLRDAARRIARVVVVPVVNAQHVEQLFKLRGGSADHRRLLGMCKGSVGRLVCARAASKAVECDAHDRFLHRHRNSRHAAIISSSY